jgi:uncharacterized Zn-binding protein involved in type VI secretion
MPAAARITDAHSCPLVSEKAGTPHVGGPILPAGELTVLIGYMPAARVTDKAFCDGPPDVIVAGSPTVLIGGQPAARAGDKTAHGGVITAGCPSVLIGASGQGGALRSTKAFVEQCEPAPPGSAIDQEIV